MLKKLKRDDGFTIIEVLIVLAIAGLIMLIVFLAVPALQRNSRNTQRRSDVSGVLGAISEYKSNNNGALPTADTQIESLVEMGFYTPTDLTLNTACTSTTCAAIADPGDSTLVLVNNAKCPATVNPTGTVAVTYSSRSVAAVFQVENNTNQCQTS